MKYQRGGTLSERKHLCPRCGRILIPGESCECYMATRDGLRAVCPRFAARLNYKGKYYIQCSDRKLKYIAKANRDSHYATYCCGDPESCPRILEERRIKEVVRCAQCDSCYEIRPRTGPLIPYKGDGDGSFYCAEWDMEMYSPHYVAEEYFCGDGRRREK